MIRMLSLIAAALALSACYETKGDDSAFASVVWTVFEIDGAAPVNAGVPTLLFNGEGNVSGRGPCNSWGGSYDLRGDRIEITNIFSTKMACPGPIGEEEARFFAALDAVDRIKVAEGGLTLSEGSKARISGRK